MTIAKTLLAAALAGAALASATAAAAETGAQRSCFFVNQWDGWKSPAPDVLLLKVGMHDIYRVQLSGKSYSLNSPGVHLVSRVRGSGSICDALDLDLAIADDHGGYREALIARSMTKLTPEEVAAIPPKDRP